jgi:hypothetical protein
MAEALRDQVDALTGFSTTEDLALKDWFEAGIKEVINYMPPKLLKLCAAMQTFTSVAAGSEAETLNTGKLLSVLSTNTRCREIASDFKGRASDSDDILYATSTDPVFYVEANLINVLPSGLSCKYEEVQYPTVTVASDTAIAVFPDEAEYLVVLYAAIKALHVLMNDKAGHTEIATAIALVNTELDETQAVCDKIDADLVLAKAEVVLAKTEAAELATQTDNSGDYETALDAINTALDKMRADGGDPALFGDESTYTTSSSAMTRVKTSLDNAIGLIGFTTAGDKYAAAYDLEANMSDIDTELTNEDIELAGARMQQAQIQMSAVSSHLSVAQAHISEWNTMVQTLSAEVNGFVAEAQARGGFSAAKARAVQGYISTAQTYVSSAQGFSTEVQAKIGIANGYIAEINSRLSVDSTEYIWYEKQQAKLQSDYDRGLMALSGRQFAPSRAGGQYERPRVGA